MHAEELAKLLGGRRTGSTWMARCPMHEDSTPSLSISLGRDGKVLVHCHAGCNQRDLFAEFCKRGFVEPLRKSKDFAPPTDAASKTEWALKIWSASQPPAGTAVEAYLASRKLVLPASSDLRFHPGLKHPCGTHWPAMVALVRDGKTGTPRAIHRTFLARDGSAKAALDPDRMMFGPCRGGAVRLADPTDVLMVGEGVETCLSVMQETGHPAWAALSTFGLVALELPATVRDVIVLADGDEPGEDAAKACALRWKRQGRRVRIARPPAGMDFNDLLVASAGRSK